MTDVSAFDPGEHTVEEVLAHLDGADEAEQARIYDAERAGKARVGILDTAPFEPAEHTVEEVNAHLAGADPDEQARVLEAEAAGKNRATVRAPAPPAEEPAADPVPHSSFVDAAHAAAVAALELADAIAAGLREVSDKHTAVIRDHAPGAGEEPVWYAHNRVGFALTDVEPVLAALRSTAGAARDETTSRGAVSAEPADGEDG